MTNTIDARYRDAKEVRDSRRLHIAFIYILIVVTAADALLFGQLFDAGGDLKTEASLPLIAVIFLTIVAFFSLVFIVGTLDDYRKARHAFHQNWQMSPERVLANGPSTSKVAEPASDAETNGPRT